MPFRVASVVTCWHAVVQAEVVHGLSGDEVRFWDLSTSRLLRTAAPGELTSRMEPALVQVDTSNIIQGGRRTRRGGAGANRQRTVTRTPEPADQSDDEW